MKLGCRPRTTRKIMRRDWPNATSIQSCKPRFPQRESVLHLSNTGINALATPYKEAKFEVPRRIEPHELSTKDLADILLKIVQQEGPVHEDEVVNRARDLWGFARAGGRIQDAVAKGVRSLIVTKRCTREEGFLSLPEAPIQIRTREDVNSLRACLKNHDC